VFLAAQAALIDAQPVSLAAQAALIDAQAASLDAQAASLDAQAAFLDAQAASEAVFWDMRYTMNDLVECSGLAARTIRRYVSLGIIPPPDGMGGGALYTDLHFERVIAVSRMRAQGIPLSVCAEEIVKWTDPRLRRYLAESDPKKDGAPRPPAASEPAALPGGKSSKLQKPGKGDGPLAKALPPAPSFRFIPLLPDLVLCVGDGASEIVLRVAAEIYERYGSAGTNA
jgi:DNA-binding transcriptional MerR regulator